MGIPGAWQFLKRLPFTINSKNTDHLLVDVNGLLHRSALYATSKDMSSFWRLLRHYMSVLDPVRFQRLMNRKRVFIYAWMDHHLWPNCSRNVNDDARLNDFKIN